MSFVKSDRQDNLFVDELVGTYQCAHVETTMPYDAFDLPLHVLSFGVRVYVVVCYPRRQTSYIP